MLDDGFKEERNRVTSSITRNLFNADFDEELSLHLHDSDGKLRTGKCSENVKRRKFFLLSSTCFFSPLSTADGK